MAAVIERGHSLLKDIQRLVLVCGQSERSSCSVKDDIRDFRMQKFKSRLLSHFLTPGKMTACTGSAWHSVSFCEER